MNDFRNRLIFVGSLGVVFIFTLIFSYGPGYGGRLSAFLGNNVTNSPKMSPSDMVTPMVTQKKMVTLQNVTNVTTVSPTLSPSLYNDSQYYSVSPSVTPLSSDVTTVSPTLSPQTSVSPSLSTTPRSTTSTPQPSETPSPTPSPTQTPTPTSVTIDVGSVVINEIAWMGTGGTAKLSNDEWIELYNTTSRTIDLTGWILKSLTGTSPDPQIALSNSIQPFGFYLLERTDDTTVSNILAGQVYTGSLLDTGENLELVAPSGLLIDAVRSEGLWYAGNKEGRFSMERIDSSKFGDISNNWGTNNGLIVNGLNSDDGPINGTPGAPNSVTTP
ncbi:MAG: hypothetical protein A2735_00405 [Candidatus Yanofskybacteria bacterium RIFCSPHIGHO2_01_FULL_41_21]|uniref:LTD domain-containing protein n=1 Tax=Candidatus Yanofskybacteria bacterium RIFCSPHIGHO2_01_FULL_41_21 TaxID=1802660 RepID=A0A1F8EDV2_9BACT|nr:MAG: hypothetical protein A2735_00405 [Candidatus Yanofskybacteria bacterium RIFCSPHIGHO2_01_FULL_41_21]